MAVQGDGDNLSGFNARGGTTQRLRGLALSTIDNIIRREGIHRDERREGRIRSDVKGAGIGDGVPRRIRQCRGDHDILIKIVQRTRRNVYAPAAIRLNNGARIINAVNGDDHRTTGFGYRRRTGQGHLRCGFRHADVTVAFQRIDRQGWRDGIHAHRRGEGVVVTRRIGHGDHDIIAALRQGAEQGWRNRDREGAVRGDGAGNLLAANRHRDGLALACQTGIPGQCLAGGRFSAIKRVVTAKSWIQCWRNAVDRHSQIRGLTDGVALSINQADGHRG